MAGTSQWSYAIGDSILGLVMGLILGGMAETSFHQAFQISGASYAIFVARPLSAGILLASAAIVMWSVVIHGSRRRSSVA